MIQKSCPHENRIAPITHSTVHPSRLESLHTHLVLDRSLHGSLRLHLRHGYATLNQSVYWDAVIENMSDLYSSIQLEPQSERLSDCSRPLTVDVFRRADAEPTVISVKCTVPEPRRFQNRFLREIELVLLDSLTSKPV